MAKPPKAKLKNSGMSFLVPGRREKNYISAQLSF